MLISVRAYMLFNALSSLENLPPPTDLDLPTDPLIVDRIVGWLPTDLIMLPRKRAIQA